MKHLNFLCTLVALGSASLFAPAALAITYDATSMGISAPAGASFIPTGGSLGTKSQAGYKFLGVTGGASGNEIDIGQTLTIRFEVPQIVDELILGLLFDGPEYGDPQETAMVCLNGNLPAYSLRAVGETHALWNGEGEVTHLSPAKLGLGAVWKIVDPFGSTLVSEISLYPNRRVAGSDFGLTGFTTHEVPDATSTAGLLGLALLGLAFGRRRSGS